MPGRSRLAVGIGASGTIAALGWRRGALSASGAAGAVAVGTAAYAAGGVRWAAPMVGFFALSSALSRLGGERKVALQEVAAKGARRDLGQVLANGGVPLALAVLALRRGAAEQRWPAYLGALAAVNADTWSTEIGALSARPPRSILTGRPVRPGASGGVTPLGLGAAVAGGLAIGGIGAIGSGRRSGGGLPPSAAAALGAAAGLGGSLVDSLLGATLQRVYRCPRCGVETERRVHCCGTPTLPARGVAVVDNDVVNGLCALAGAAIGLAVARLVAQRGA